MKTILVCGAGGFIGVHLVKSLKQQGHYVIGADLKYPEFTLTHADEFYLIDLRDQVAVNNIVTQSIDEIYQLAADMGGAGYIFSGNNDADIMHNSAQINLNIANLAAKKKVKKVFFSSSACIYPEHNQVDSENPNLEESSAYPANPDSEYGWEKLFSERLYLAHAKNHGLQVRIARLHNVFGPFGSWNNGKEKAPAAICRKVAESTGIVEIWGDGNQTRSFLYIDDCIEGIHRIMNSTVSSPLNLGSDRSISINQLTQLVAGIAEKFIQIVHTNGPVGVAGRNSHNQLITHTIGWAPNDNLEHGLRETYQWINNQIKEANNELVR
jgi:GDP-D-mannose 3', 5'-epimerase